MYDYKAQFEFSFPATYGETTIEVIESDCLEAAIHLKLQRGTSWQPTLLPPGCSCMTGVLLKRSFLLLFFR